MRSTTAKATSPVARWLLAVTVMVSPPVIAREATSLHLDVLWSTPITAAPPPPPPGTTYYPESGSGLLLIGRAMLPDGRIAFLGNELAPRALSQVLLPDAERGGPDKTVPIQLGETPSSAPSWLQRLIGNKPRQRPYVSVLAAGPTGELWVAGFTNAYTDIASAPHSDAYIAQIDESGKVHWERSFGDGGRRSIESIAAIGAGDLIVAGRDGRQGWIARVGEGGRQVWDLRVGNDKGIAVAPLSNDQLVVAGFEATGSSQAKGYRDDVTVWIIDG